MGKKECEKSGGETETTRNKKKKGRIGQKEASRKRRSLCHNFVCVIITFLQLIHEVPFRVHYRNNLYQRFVLNIFS